MADTNEKKRRELDCPLFKLIEETWIDYDSRISTFTISEEDVFRYTLWCLEGIKDNAGNRARHEDKMRALLFQQIRKRYGSHSQPEEINFLADIIMAYTLECLEWAQTADWTTFMSIYNEVHNSIDTKDGLSILSYKKAFNEKVFEMNLCASFKLWISDYLTNDMFLTDEDAEWEEDESYTSTLQVEEIEGQNPNNEIQGSTLLGITTILKYCSDREKCEIIVQMLSGCKCVKDLKNAVLSIDADGAMIDMCTMDKIQFCRDIIPLINYETKDKDIKQVIHRLRKP